MSAFNHSIFSFPLAKWRTIGMPPIYFYFTFRLQISWPILHKPRGLRSGFNFFPKTISTAMTYFLMVLTVSKLSNGITVHKISSKSLSPINKRSAFTSVISILFPVSVEKEPLNCKKTPNDGNSKNDQFSWNFSH